MRVFRDFILQTLSHYIHFHRLTMEMEGLMFTLIVGLRSINMTDLYVGQTLRHRDGEKCIIRRINEEEIIVEARNKLYAISIEAIGRQLFIVSDKSDSSKQIRTLTINENGDWEYLGEKTAKSKIQHERTVCDDCRGCWEYLKSDCMGEEETCKAFFPKVSLSQREMSHWPEYGDATYYRIHGKWRE